MNSFEKFKPIGGYFELELNKGTEFHNRAIHLNTGRNCLEYILLARKYKKVYIPYYTCDVILEPFLKTDTKFEFYNINKDLEPLNINIGKNEAILYTNYFGIKSIFINKLSKMINNLIIDNSQAFFDKPISGIDTFYSPRKFFGVPDGGYLYIEKKIGINSIKDISLDRTAHLLKRIEISPEAGYSDFNYSENHLKGLPIRQMSSLTSRILAGVDYQSIIKSRKRNFYYIHKALYKFNLLKICRTVNVPMSYPLLINKDLRFKLRQNRIFIPIYWPNILDKLPYKSLEFTLAKNLHSLPIDQRYNKSDLDEIIHIVKKYV